MGITITKMIEEPTNGRRFNEVTGKYERRTGVRHEEHVVKGKVKMIPVTIWEETEAPRTFVYGSAEHEETGFKGGTIRTEIEGCEPLNITLHADEVEYLLRRYATQYADAMFILRGGTRMGGRPISSPLDAVQERDEALVRAARFGVDLAATNVDTSSVWAARDAARTARQADADQKAEDGVGKG